MAHVALEKPVHRSRAGPPILQDHWVLELPNGATFSAPIWFDEDGDPVFSLPLAELRRHIALREQHAGEIDFRLLTDGGLEIDLGDAVIAQ
jgi:hypothetical protein